MEERKLIRLGNSSFAVALPKSWIEKSGLKKGDKVFIVPNSNGELIISSELKKKNEKEVEINIDDKDEIKIKREFTSKYISGNLTFKFVGNSIKKKKSIIKKMIQEYIGCEVVEEGENYISIKDFFDFGEINLNRFLKRMGNNLSEMFELLISKLKKSKISRTDLKEIEEIDIDVNKFYFLISRTMFIGLDNPSITNKLKMDSNNLFYNWWFAFHLEQIGDDIKSVSKKISSKNNENLRKELIEILTEIKIKYENSLKSYYESDIEKAMKLMEVGEKLWEKCIKLSVSSNPLLSSISENLKSIENASYQILKMTLNVRSLNVNKE